MEFDLTKKLEFIKKKNLIYTKDTDFKNILETLYPELNFIRDHLYFYLKNETVSILIKSVLKEYFKEPGFSNYIVLKNNLNFSNEFLQNYCRTPYVNIIGNYTSLNEFILEKYESHFVSNVLCGFYVNIKKKMLENELITFYDCVTPFIIKKNEVLLIEKNEGLKYDLFYFSNETNFEVVLEVIYISYSNTELNIDIFKQFKQLFNLNIELDELFKKYKYNCILNENQEKNIYMNCMDIFSFPNENECFQNENLVMLTIDHRLFIDPKIQHEYYTNLIKSTIDICKSIIENTIFNFNEKNTIEGINLKNEVYKISRDKLQIKLNSNNDYYEISNDKSILMRCICFYNQILMGKDAVKIKKNLKLDKKKILTDCDNFLKKITNVLDLYYKDCKLFYEKKQKNL